MHEHNRHIYFNFIGHIVEIIIASIVNIVIISQNIFDIYKISLLLLYY